MSYSFGVKAASVDEAKTKVRDELVKVVEQQPIHKLDCDQAFNATESLLKLLRAPKDGENVYASVSGSIWGTEAANAAHSASVNVSIGFTTA